MPEQATTRWCWDPQSLPEMRLPFSFIRSAWCCLQANSPTNTHPKAVPREPGTSAPQPWGGVPWATVPTTDTGVNVSKLLETQLHPRQVSGPAPLGSHTTTGQHRRPRWVSTRWRLDRKRPGQALGCGLQDRRAASHPTSACPPGPPARGDSRCPGC